LDLRYAKILKDGLNLKELTMQNEILSFLSSLNVKYELNNTTLISPYTLSIYIPEKQVAIECYELKKQTFDLVGKKSCNEKAISCFSKNIQLIQFFEDEWKEKKDICKSMIMHRLGIFKEKVHARKCKVEEISGTESRAFFNTSHIAGGTRAKIHFGLRDKSGRIVSILSFRKPVQKKKDVHLTHGIVEIARFATLPYVHIPGGFSKLFSVAVEWVRKEGFKKILTYAELRFGEGKVYKVNNFTFRGRTSGEMYWYIKYWEGTDPEKGAKVPYGKRFFRFKYRARKPLTEKQVADEVGCKKIYGSTNNVFEMIL
jgi:hypothetical protein